MVAIKTACILRYFKETTYRHSRLLIRRITIANTEYSDWHLEEDLMQIKYILCVCEMNFVKLPLLKIKKKPTHASMFQIVVLR